MARQLASVNELSVPCKHPDGQFYVLMVLWLHMELSQPQMVQERFLFSLYQGIMQHKTDVKWKDKPQKPQYRCLLLALIMTALLK